MSGRRLAAVARRESLELLRDPFRLTIAFVTPVLLLVVLGFGLSIDVEALRVAALDRDLTPASRAYLAGFRHSRVFDFRGFARSPRELERALEAGRIAVALEIPPGFQRRLVREEPVAVSIAVDGTVPFVAATARGYVEAVHRRFAAERGVGAPDPVRIETRFWYNQTVESRLAFVPALLAALLVIVPSMLTAVAVVREKELGAIVNLYASPLTRSEFLLGKQLPYAAVSLASFGLLFALALLLFGIPFRGSLATLTSAALLYVLAATGLGLFVSCFTRTQVAALLISILVTLLPAFLYSGFFTPVESLSGAALWVAKGFPAAWFLDVSVGTFTKGLGLADLWTRHAVLAAFALGLDAASLAALRAQED